MEAADVSVKPQIYTWRGLEEPSQYCGDIAYERTYPQVEGGPSDLYSFYGPQPFIKNQGDWISVTKTDSGGCGLAIRSDGTLWTWGESPINISHRLMHGVYGYSTEILQVGTDTDWVKCSGGLLLKRDGSMWSIGTNARGSLGLGVSGGTWTGTFSEAAVARLHSSIESVTPTATEFSSKPTVSIEARTSDRYTTLDIESGFGGDIEAVWYGRISGISVTSSGAGYMSPPAVTIIPVAAEDAGKVATAEVSVMTQSKTASFRVLAGGSGYTYASVRDGRTNATATAVIAGGVITSWTMTSEGSANNPLLKYPAYITGDGNGAQAEAVPYPSGVTGIRMVDNPEVWIAPPRISIEGTATAAVDSLSGPVQSFEVVHPGTGYSTSYDSYYNADNPYHNWYGYRPAGARNRVLYAVASDGVKTEVAGIVNLSPGPVHSLSFNLGFTLPAGNVVSVYFNRDGQSPAIGWYEFGGSSGLLQPGDGYAIEPPAYIVYGGVAEPRMVSAGPWKDIDGTGETTFNLTNYGRNAIDSSGKLWWWGRGFSSGGVSTYPTPVGQGIAIDVDPTVQMTSSVSGPYPVSVSLSVTPPDSPSGVQASGGANGQFLYGSADYSLQQYSYTYGLFATTLINPGLGYTSVPTVTSSPAGVTATARLVGPVNFTHVQRGLARDENGQWWNIGYWSAGSTRPVFFTGTETKETVDSYHVNWYSSKSASSSHPVMRAAFVEEPGSGYKAGDKLRVVVNTYSVQTTTGQFSTPTGYKEVKNLSLLPAVQTFEREVRSLEAMADGSFPPVVVYGDIVSASIVSATGSGATVVVVDLPNWSDVPPMRWATLFGGMKPTASGSFIPMPDWANPNSWANWYGPPWMGSSVKSIDSSSSPTYGSGYRGGELAGAVAYDGEWTLLGDGQIRDEQGRRFGNPTPKTSRNLSLKLTSTGAGYTDPVRVELSQPAGVASAVAAINGSVVTIGVLDGGGGYRTPPSISIVGGATADAVIQGPVDAVAVTAAGSGYRIPPVVRFSQPGMSATATCTLSENGGVAEVAISNGGTYRAAPSVSFEPVPDIDAITVTNAGGSYTSAPEVRIVAGSGGGSGGAAYCTLNGSGGVGQVVITNRGSGYLDTPKVLFIGGGGDGATAVASVVAHGSGAAATATIIGKMIFAKVTNGGSGYQTAPAVTATASPTGEVPILQARILGPVSAVSLTGGGSGYKAGDYYNGVVTAAIEKEFEHTAGSLSTTGSVASVSITSGGLYSNVPSITFGDAYGARADTNLTRQTVSLYGTQAAAGPIRKSIGNLSGGYGLDGQNLHLSAVGPIGGFDNIGYYGYGLTFSTSPTITVEDVAGSGCVLSPTFGSGGRLASIAVTNGGAGYTFNAKLSIRGGRRYVWDHQATATAVVNANGEVVAINVTSAGGGYNAAPDIIISGGGGTGATARVASFSYQADGLGIATIAVANKGAGYTYTPTVTVIDKNVIDGSNAVDFLTSSAGVYLSSAMPEYAWQDVPQQRSLSVVEYLHAGKADWRFLPHYIDGWVEYLYIFNGSRVADRAYASSPSVTIYGAGVGGATGQAKLVKWSPVFCENIAVRLE